MERSNYNNWKKGPFIFLFIIGAVFGLTWVVMTLWNGILPDVIHVTEVTYWQAMGILLLSKILFGGFKYGPRGRHNHRRKFKEKFMNMTDEQKETFKEEWRSRCRK